MKIRSLGFAILGLLIMVWSRGEAIGQDAPSAYVGNWSGELAVREQTLEIGFSFTLTDQGLTAVMHSPDQGAFDIPASATVNSDGITVTVTGADVTFTGTLANANTIEGTFSQRGNSFPLTIMRQETAPVRETLNRPQTPQPPFNYVVEDFKFSGGEHNVTLAGTLTKPYGTGPFPAIITITGSGPQDRDETIAEHKPFHVIADHLTKAGFAVLRYDDRGIAESTGDFRSATSADFATDANAAVTALMTRDDIDPKRITLLGHSEGGLIAPLAAKDNQNVSALILLAPPIATMAEVARVQTRLQGESNGLSEREIQAELDEIDQMIRVFRSTQTVEEARIRARQLLDESDFDEDRRAHALRNIERQINPWSHFMFNYDPSETLRDIEIPVLALFAEKDVSVEPVRNRELFESINAQSDDAQNWRGKTFSGLNHLFQTANTGAQSEYREIEETINPAVLNTIQSWISDIQLTE